MPAILTDEAQCGQGMRVPALLWGAENFLLHWGQVTSIESKEVIDDRLVRVSWFLSLNHKLPTASKARLGLRFKEFQWAIDFRQRGPARVIRAEGPFSFSQRSKPTLGQDKPQRRPGSPTPSLLLREPLPARSPLLRTFW